MRTISVITVARSDYGIYLPILRRIQGDPDLRLSLIVGGMHLSPTYGSTVKMIEADGFPIDERVEILAGSDSPANVAKSIGLGVIGFSKAYARLRPELLVVLGDRFEMYSAALAALPFKYPVAHIHGGEVTHGAMDDALRHSMTKLSHLHFVATQEYAERVIQLGEEPWRVIVSGAPGLDNLQTVRLQSRQELEKRYAVDLHSPFLLVTFHPVTLEFEQVDAQVVELMVALDGSGLPVIFTQPNADMNSHVISQKIAEYIERHPQAKLIDNLGMQDYFSLMAIAAGMVGNSSSGIIEAPSFGLPVVNIGSRQAGRVRGENVIDVPCERISILEGIRKALQPEFKQQLFGKANPYSQGNAAETIVRKLKSIALDQRLIAKRFYDLTHGHTVQDSKP